MGYVDLVTEVWSGGDASVQSKGDGTGSASIGRSFEVVVNNTGRYVDALQVLADSRLPKIGSQYWLSSWFKCEDLSVTRTSPITFDVTAIYKTESTEVEGSPLQEPASVSFSSTSTDGAVDEDINGTPILTANGESISGVKMPFVDLKANVSKNIASFNPVSIYVYGNAVNSVAFMGFPAGVVRCSSISAKQNISDEFSFWTVSVEFEFRRPINTTNDKAWWSRIRHEGFKVKTPHPTNAGEFIYPHAIDDGGKEVTKPVMLKEDGTPETDPEVAYFQEWEVHKKENLNSMGLFN
jgi:hypothetical protein